MSYLPYRDRFDGRINDNAQAVIGSLVDRLTQEHRDAFHASECGTGHHDRRDCPWGIGYANEPGPEEIIAALHDAGVLDLSAAVEATR